MGLWPLSENSVFSVVRVLAPIARARWIHNRIVSVLSVGRKSGDEGPIELKNVISKQKNNIYTFYTVYVS